MRTQSNRMSSPQDKRQSEGKVRLDISPGSDDEDADSEVRGGLETLGDTGVYGGFDDVQEIVGWEGREGLL